MKLIQLFYLFLFIISTKAYSESVYNKLVETANYAKISYCSINPYFGVGFFANECSKTSFCTESQNTHTRIAAVIKPDYEKGAISGNSYVAVNDVTKQVYAVFRGTLSLGDVITDLTALQCPYVPLLANNLSYKEFNNSTDPNSIKNLITNKSTGKAECPDCLVHCGVYTAFVKNIQSVANAAIPFLEQGYNLTVTGHSLGGAFALLGGIEFRSLGYEPLLITYASLRVGNPEFNQWVDENLFATESANGIIENGDDLPFPSYSRVYQKTDEIPKLPLNIPGSIKYTHSGLKFAIDKVELPHLQKNVLFQGESDNFANDAANITQYQPPISEWVYQHTHQFMKFECNDSDKGDDDTLI